jgi:hypothetical protein
MQMPFALGWSSFLCSFFINASYTLIASGPALTVGVFTPALGDGLAEREGHQLQNRDNHSDPALALFWKALA